MTRTRSLAAALGAALTAQASPALAQVMTANCTGMIDAATYQIDPALPEQEIAGLGPARVSRDETSIRVEGTFGEYRFDLKAGTLYHNGRDTGLYCTYRGIER